MSKDFARHTCHTRSSKNVSPSSLATTLLLYLGVHFFFAIEYNLRYVFDCDRASHHGKAPSATGGEMVLLEGRRMRGGGGGTLLLGGAFGRFGRKKEKEADREGGRERNGHGRQHLLHAVALPEK